MPLHLDEARHRAQLVSDVATTITLDLTAEADFTVHAVVSFTCGQPGADTFLELTAATDLRATLNGAPLLDYDGERIPLPALAAHNTVEVSARLPYVIDGDGMTVTLDPADGERYVCAFTAMDVARKVIPCFDQPDIKTTFSVTVTAPEHWTVLANGVSPSLPASANGARTWTFAPTPPISSYLFFVTGGPYVSRTWEEPYAGGTLPFGWHARASQQRELDRDFDELRRITSTCFQHYTTVFDEPYAFADYQQVFTPGLNWGAMEFPGCVAFRDEFLTQGTPTALDRQGMASTIAHEMAHMWFGDLVTMRWWEDSWLNESFADFMGYEVAAVAAGYEDSWTGAALVRKPTGYRADRRRSTHPVAEDADQMPDADTAFANFDMITYAKGNGVLRQLGTWLGEDFITGVNAHLSAHPFGNADLADFLDALDGASDRDVRGWADAWLRTTGFDTLQVTRDGDVPVLTRHGSRPHRFTVAAYDEGMNLLDTIWVDVADEAVRLDQFAGRVVVPNAGDETFAAIRPDEHSWRVITEHLASVADPLTRAVLWWTAIDLAESRSMSVADLVGLADRHLRPERHPVVFEGAIEAVLSVVRRWGSPEEVAELLDVLADVATHILSAGDPLLAPAASRILASASHDQEMLRGWLQGEAVDQEVRWLVVRRLASLGDDSHIEAEAARDRSVAGDFALLRARAAVPTLEAKEVAWAHMMGGTTSSHEFPMIAQGFWDIEQTELVRPWLTRYVTDALTLARTSGQGLSHAIGRSFPWLPHTDETRRELRDALVDALEHGDVPTVLARAWNDQLDDLDRTQR